MNIPDPLWCAPCLLQWQAWEDEHAAKLTQYYETDPRTGRRTLYLPASCRLSQTMPKLDHAATIATVALHPGAIPQTAAVCARHLTTPHP